MDRTKVNKLQKSSQINYYNGTFKYTFSIMERSNRQNE